MFYRAINYNFTASGNEDCLFLSVFAASGAAGLPVMVWIRMYQIPVLYLTVYQLLETFSPL